MNMKQMTVCLAVAAGFAVSALPCGLAVAQESKPVQPAKPAPDAKAIPAAEPAAAPKAPEPIRWSDPEFEKAAGMLSGTWKSAAALPQGDVAGATAEVILGAAPVRFPGLSDTLYFETARADAMWKPFRQGIWQLYRNKGELRMRTFEFRRVKGEMFSAISAWASPDHFPNEISVADLIGTLDLKLTLASDSLSGKTPHPYPTGNGGAVEMTSEFKVTKDGFDTMDRGYDAAGKVVWGPAAGQKYTFKKAQAPVSVKKSEDGLVIVDYTRQTTGEPAGEGWRVAVYHTASLMNGVVFDSSRERERPYILTIGQPMPMGVAKGLEGIKQGDLRRLIIPPAMGFGEAGNRRSKVPGNATLFYEIEAVTTEPPAPAPDPAAAGPASPTPPGRSPTITPVDAPPFKVDPSMLPGAKPKEQPK